MTDCLRRNEGSTQGAKIKKIDGARSKTDGDIIDLVGLEESPQSERDVSKVQLRKDGRVEGLSRERRVHGYEGSSPRKGTKKSLREGEELVQACDHDDIVYSTPDRKRKETCWKGNGEEGKEILNQCNHEDIMYSTPDRKRRETRWERVGLLRSPKKTCKGGSQERAIMTPEAIYKILSDAEDPKKAKVNVRTKKIPDFKPVRPSKPVMILFNVN